MEFDYPRQKRKMKRDLKLEGISVLGNIMDFVAFRKLVPDYRPTNRRPDKILKNPLINQLDGALVYLFVSAKTKCPLIKLGINQPDDMSLLQARKKIS